MVTQPESLLIKNKKTTINLIKALIIIISCLGLVYAIGVYMEQKKLNVIFRQTAIQEELKEKIVHLMNSSNDGEILELKNITPFTWEKVCILGMGASSDYINQVIGIRWLKEKVYVPEQRQLLVFVQNNNVTEHLLFRPEVIGSSQATDYRLGICLSDQTAIFTIKQFDFQTNSFRLLMLPNE